MAPQDLGLPVNAFDVAGSGQPSKRPKSHPEQPHKRAKLVTAPVTSDKLVLLSKKVLAFARRPESVHLMHALMKILECTNVDDVVVRLKEVLSCSERDTGGLCRCCSEEVTLQSYIKVLQPSPIIPTGIVRLCATCINGLLALKEGRQLEGPLCSYRELDGPLSSFQPGSEEALAGWQRHNVPQRFGMDVMLNGIIDLVTAWVEKCSKLQSTGKLTAMPIKPVSELFTKLPSLTSEPSRLNPSDPDSIYVTFSATYCLLTQMKLDDLYPKVLDLLGKEGKKLVNAKEEMTPSRLAAVALAVVKRTKGAYLSPNADLPDIHAADENIISMPTRAVCTKPSKLQSEAKKTNEEFAHTLEEAAKQVCSNNSGISSSSGRAAKAFLLAGVPVRTCKGEGSCSASGWDDNVRSSRKTARKQHLWTSCMPEYVCSCAVSMSMMLIAWVLRARFAAVGNHMLYLATAFQSLILIGMAGTGTNGHVDPAEARTWAFMLTDGPLSGDALVSMRDTVLAIWLFVRPMVFLEVGQLCIFLDILLQVPGVTVSGSPSAAALRVLATCAEEQHRMRRALMLDMLMNGLKLNGVQLQKVYDLATASRLPADSCIMLKQCSGMGVEVPAGWMHWVHNVHDCLKVAFEVLEAEATPASRRCVDMQRLIRSSIPHGMEAYMDVNGGVFETLFNWAKWASTPERH